MRVTLKSLAVAVGIAASVWTSGAALAATSIDTSAGPFGFVEPFGETDTATYGQTFTVTGPEKYLTQFAFRFDDLLDTDTIDFAGYVYAWDGLKATGPALYTTAMRTSSNNGGAGGMEEFSFATGYVPLVIGQQYVAFLSVSEFFDGQDGTSFWELSEGDVLPGESFVFINNGSDMSLLTSQEWDSSSVFVDGQDTWFKATFSIPAPLPLGLLALGALGLPPARPRRRR